MPVNPPSPYLYSGNSVSFVSIYPTDCLTTRPGPEGSGHSHGQLNGPCVFSQDIPHSVLGPDNSSRQPQGYSRSSLSPVCLQFPDWPGRAEFGVFSHGSGSLSFSKATLHSANSDSSLAAPGSLLPFGNCRCSYLLRSCGHIALILELRLPNPLSLLCNKSVFKQGDLSSK